MEFQLEKSQKEIQKAVREFSKGEFDKELAQEMDKTNAFPTRIWQNAADLGFIGIHFPEDFSGGGMGFLENTLIAEEFCKKDSTIGAAIMLSCFAAEYVLRFGSDQQKQAFIPDVLEGKVMSGAAFFGSEYRNGSTGNMPVAEKTKEGWRLSGEIDYVINGGKAGFYCVLCTNGSDQNHLNMVIVKDALDGVSFENHSATHDYLIRRLPGETSSLWLKRMRDDIGRAQKRLTEELGRAPTLFAYPYGEYDEPLANLVRELGLVGFGQQSGPAGLGADLRALPRFPMAERFADLADFKQKLQTQAFPVIDLSPWNPLLENGQPPRMVVSLADSEARLDQLSCFVSGQGKVAVEWLDRQARRFAVQALATLPKGRGRYNCTAPSKQAGRYFWLSQMWIVP